MSTNWSDSRVLGRCCEVAAAAGILRLIDWPDWPHYLAAEVSAPFRERCDWLGSPHYHVAEVSAPFHERCDWPDSRYYLEAAAATMGSCFAGPRQRDSHGPRRFEVYRD